MKISTILDHIDQRHMALPEFQRGYVWNREQVRGLMTSLYRRHPIGTLLVWVTESSSAQYRGDGPLAPGIVKLLLDGQQRITSLYGIMRGCAPDFFDGNAATFTGLYFNMESEEFRFYMPTIMDSDPLWINVSELMTSGDGGIGGIARRFSSTPETLQTFFEKYNDRLSSLLMIRERELHIEEVTGKDKTLQIVVDIFNRVNSGGTKLSKGDLALAKICASWPEARDSMKTNLAEWEKSGFDFDLDWQLRILNAVLTGEARFEHLHSATPDQVIAALKTTKKCADYLLNLIAGRLGIDHSKVLFGRYSFPVMARYLNERGGRLTDITEQNKLLLWYLLSAIWGRYSSSTETVISKDLSLIEKLDGGLDRLLTEVQFWQGGLTVEPEHFNSWSTGARFYPFLYLLTRTGEAKDFGTGLALKKSLLGPQSQLEVHHIFPKSLLYARGYSKSEVNSLANYCFLTKQTNVSLISNRNPEEYFVDVENTFPGSLASQWIPMDSVLWKMENYREFLAARRTLLAEAANNFIGSLLPKGFAEAIIDRPEDWGMRSHLDEFHGKSPEETIKLLQEWLANEGLPCGSTDYELVNPVDGQSLALFDLAWAKGFREELDAPVGISLQAKPGELEAATAQGFVCFGCATSFKQYVLKNVLGRGLSDDINDEEDD